MSLAEASWDLKERENVEWPTLPPPLELVKPPEPTREELLFLFTATTTDRQDLDESLFDGDPMVAELRNRTEPVPIIIDVIRKMYKVPHWSQDFAEVHQFVEQRYAAYKEFVGNDDSAAMAKRIDEIATSYHQDNDLRRGFAGFRSAANDFHNYTYEDTSLAVAGRFCNFLTAGDLF